MLEGGGGGRQKDIENEAEMNISTRPRDKLYMYAVNCWSTCIC